MQHCTTSSSLRPPACAALQRQRMPSLLAARRPAAAAGALCCRRGQVVVRADAGGFFNKKKGAGKEDAARKALQDMFSGKKDLWALDEERAKKRGSGGGGSGSGGIGGGGGSGGSGGFNFGEWSDGFRKGAKGILQTIGAVLLFAAALGAMALWRPLVQLLTALVRVVLRLDGNPRAQLASDQKAAQMDLSKKDGLGNVEASVISKYGQAEGEEESSGEEDGSEGEE